MQSKYSPSNARTLLVSEVFPPQTGGSGRWFWEIYSRLPKEAYPVAAGEYAGADEFDATHELDLTRLPLKLDQWGLRSAKGLSGYFRLIKQLRRIIKDRNVQTLHTARVLPEGWLALCLRFLCGIRYVVYVHGEEVESATSSRELSWMVRKVVGRAEFLIANSHNTRRILESNWNVPTTKIRMLHPGVDTTRFVPAPRDDAFRQEMGWDDRPVVLAVGRLQKRKGHDVTLRAITQLRKTHPDILYAICGDGDERNALEALTDELDLREHVQFLGEPDDTQLIRCYQQCDLFLLANRSVGKDIEGFGIVLLEAQACGKPVIAGDSGGTSETMQVPETGCIVDCTKPEPLEQLLAELLTDPDRREQMGRAAREWTVANFDWASLAQNAQSVFEGRPLPRTDVPHNSETATVS